MAGVKAILFGRFTVERDNRRIESIEASKVKELLAYLLISRGKPQPRESLAELLWKNQPPDKSRKCLRQTLWKLKSALVEHCDMCPSDLLVDTEWIQMSPSADWWVDIVEFERAFNGVKDKRAKALSADDFLALQQGIDLYKGDLLEGWYQDWCLLERERLQSIYMLMLSKLVQYCELHHLVDMGLAFGEKLLSHDRAYERAHRQMMRLYFMAGDRTRALRQYERCVTALREELGIGPAERTVQLYERLKADTLHRPLSHAVDKDPRAADQILKDTAVHLDRFVATLTDIKSQLNKDIGVIENELRTG
jgi:DNA-binding SARP family transcriptional activator